MLTQWSYVFLALTHWYIIQRTWHIFVLSWNHALRRNNANVALEEINETLQWCHNERDSVSNHQPHDCLLNCLFGRRSKKTLKLRVTGLCVGNSSGTGEFPAQMASYAENVSIWWRHHGCLNGPSLDFYLPCLSGGWLLSVGSRLEFRVGRSGKTVIWAI